MHKDQSLIKAAMASFDKHAETLFCPRTLVFPLTSSDTRAGQMEVYCKCILLHTRLVGLSLTLRQN